MASIVKSKLKASRDALNKKDYKAARSHASMVLEFEPENYNATVFLALALLELGEHNESEQVIWLPAYLAPKGLSRFYERVENWEKYGEVLRRTAHLLANSNDATKCAETLQKYMDLRRENGSVTQAIEALSLFLPESPFYLVLSTLPPPDPTNPTATTTFATQVAIHNSLPILEEIVSILEKEEEETFTKEFDKRRTRLNAAGPEQLKKDIGRELWSTSRLPRLYSEILNHPNTSDETRRAVEAKLLRHRQHYLFALPDSEEKFKVAEEVESLIDGVVLLGLPDELAWLLYIDGIDSETLEGYDYSVFWRFVDLFPSTPMSKLVLGYFAYKGIRNLDEEYEDENSVVEPDSGAQVDAFLKLHDSTVSHHIMAHVYLQEQEYQSAIKVAESGLVLLRRVESDRAKRMPMKEKALNIILAMSLVHLFPPKHHARAIPILDDVLSQDPNNVACLMGRGYVLQNAGKWAEATDFFKRAVTCATRDPDTHVRAMEECAWCGIQLGSLAEASTSLREVLDLLESMKNKEVDKARCWWRLGRCLWEMGDDRREEAYRMFITSLKHSPSYAPAFTSLGIYYADFVFPPDPTRASKCFQKAFELDAREAYAARRLAEGFAEDREWDLVEVVARRTIEGEGGLSGGVDGAVQTAAGRYLPTNAWAWKALGVVELNRRNYSQAIQNLQVALRGDDTDELSWLRLGEAYSKSGRHIAALKALGRAHELRADNWICSYLIADVQRQAAQYDEAIQSFENILGDLPSELGVILSLAQTYLDQGLAQSAAGFIGRSEYSFLTSIVRSLQALSVGSSGHGVAWKIIGDALFYLSQFPSFFDPSHAHDLFSRVAALVSADFSGHLTNIVSFPIEVSDPPHGGLALRLAIASYDHRISLGLDEGAAASAWFDQGISAYSLSRKTSKPQLAEKTLQRAISSVKEALRIEPDNDNFWNALGNMHFEQQPKIAQHAYIRALEVNSKDAVTWTNLGLLYLHNEDQELARETLSRAQTLDPDHVPAWLGQAFLALSYGKEVEARALFEHAVGLSADVPEADLEYAERTFAKLSSLSQRRQSHLDILLPVFFVLDRFCRRCPEDIHGLHLMSLVCEHIGHIALGLEKTEQAIAILEKAYEESEDPVIEQQFIIANTTLGRLRLAGHDYSGAVESFETVTNLLSGDEQPATRVLLVQAMFGAGLASFKLGDVGRAQGLLEEAWHASTEDVFLKAQVSVLLAQVLWGTGTVESQETAKSRLLECIADDPENLAAIAALAGMGILTDDDDLVDATLSEIVSLPVDRRHGLDPARDVTQLLIKHHLGQNNISDALSVAQQALLHEPAQQDVRRETASLILQRGDADSALAILSGAQSQGNIEDQRKSSRLHAAALALDEEGDSAQARKIAQKSIMLAPWDTDNWKTFAFTHCQSGS
ncbi:TPR-like protein [Neolentinus lepideus HHB14362 ss-1]|uniref:TPR-like protein n=1 Tax=Neolentinus lepideus HHB14362 ss-1 TaxID=1314782 RepID=A0A165UDC6_9AGAM|nr:TPR-like protein [Neolentinus lepideus HHB14362 ss-1]